MESQEFLTRTRSLIHALDEGDYRGFDRHRFCVEMDDPVHERVYRDAHFLRVGSLLAGYDVQTDYPMDVREYPGESRGMSWHPDVLCYDPIQIEFSVTLYNEDECTRFEWQDRDAGMWYRDTRPGDVIMVLAGTSYHRVTNHCGGLRTILKVAITPPGATPLRIVQQEKAECYSAAWKT